MLKNISILPAYRPVKRSAHIKNVLFIGEHNSGRHALMKELQIHYEKHAFDLWQRSVTRSKIIKYLIQSMKILIKHCGDNSIAGHLDADSRRIYKIQLDKLSVV